MGVMIMTMKRFTRLCAVAFSVLAISGQLPAQQLITIDLAKPTPDTIAIGAGDVTLKLVNALPSKAYGTKASLVAQAVRGPIDLGSLRKQAIGAADAKPCAMLDTLGKYFDIATEADVPRAVSALQKAMTAGVEKNAGCSDDVEALARMETAPGRYVRYLDAQISVEAGMVATVGVRRDAVTVANIVLKSNVEPRRAYFSYGVMYPTGGTIHRFALGAADTLGQRGVVRVDADRPGPSLLIAINVPTPIEYVSLSGFLPTGFSDGLLVGWGGGLSIGWADQLQLHVGGVIGRQQQLKPRYRVPGVLVKEDLTEDQLTEQSYAPRLGIGLSIRFGSNPFTTVKK